MARLLFALLFLALVGPTARAWDVGGHEIIATIAYAHLNPKARAAVDRLAPLVTRPGHPYDFVTLAGWMDDIRNDPTLADYGRFKSWHYIDIPLDPRDPTPSFVPGTDTDLHGNALQALKRALVVLDGGTDPYIRDQPTALALIEHIVGDIHQPLHCATKYFFSHGRLRDDRGGNDEFVLNGPPGDTKFNLHAFWDSAWRASFDPTTGLVVLDERLLSKADIDRELVREQASSVAGPPAKGAADDFTSWALESNALARDFVYPGITATDSHKDCRVSSAYVARANAIAWQSLALAGARLAALLNATLGAATPPPVPPSYPGGTDSVRP